MSVLILYPRRSPSTVLLADEAKALGWDTIRLEKPEISNSVELAGRPCALFYTPPGCFEVAQQLALILVACPADWLPKLPKKYLGRTIKQLSLEEAVTIPERFFYKPALNKYFETGIYNGSSLAEKTPGFPPGFQILQSEIVRWTVEYRCFIRAGRVLTHCPYRRGSQATRGQGDSMGASREEFEEALSFAQSLLDDPNIQYPPAFVLDVGKIEGQSWAVIEANECWASSIYSCDPSKVLETLLGGVIPEGSENTENRWNYEIAYKAAMNGGA